MIQAVRVPADRLQAVQERRRIKIMRWIFGRRVIRFATTFLIIAGTMFVFSRTMMG